MIEAKTGTLYALQSRNITSLRPKEVDVVALKSVVVKEVDQNVRRELHRLEELNLKVGSNVLSDQNIAEILTLDPPPVTLGLFNLVFAEGDGAIKTARNEMGYTIGPELDTGFFSFVGSQPRCSIVHDACTYRIKGMPLNDYAKIVSGYLDDMNNDPRLANYPEVVLYDQDPSQEKLIGLFGQEKGVEYRRSYDDFHRNLTEVMKVTDRDCRERFIPDWQQKIAQEKRCEHSSIEGIVTQCKRLTEMLRVDACPAFVKSARLGFFSYKMLRDRLIQLFGDKGGSYVDVLTGGTDISLNPNLQFSVKLAGLRDGNVSLKEIIQDFGHLSIHELEIGTPRYHEDSQLVETLAKQMIGNPLDDFHAAMQQSSDLKGELLATAGGSADELREMIKMARIYLPLREVVKFEYLRAYDLFRRNVVMAEKILSWDAGLMFYLYPHEIFELSHATSKKFQEVAITRRSNHDAAKSLYIPPVIFSENLSDIGDVPADNGTNLFSGLGVTNSTVSGSVVVLESLTDSESLSRLKPGSILVTKTTDPAWGPVLSIIGKEGGLITEVGGLLAHGAIYAREVGLAAVLNVPQITTKLKTGMRVTVNGPTGIVEVLS